MRVLERPPMDHSLNASGLDERALGWGIEIGPDGEVRQGPEPGSERPPMDDEPERVDDRQDRTNRAEGT